MMDVTLRELLWNIRERGRRWWHRLWPQKAGEKGTVSEQNLEGLMYSAIYEKTEAKLWKFLDKAESPWSDTSHSTESEENK